MPVHFSVNHTRSFGLDFAQLETHTHALLAESNLQDYHLNIIFADNDYLQKLNRTYRHLDKPTNVLSFPFSEGFEHSHEQIPVKELGDIIISLDKAKEESVLYNQTMKHRTTWLIVHGFLHILGYDHEKSAKDEQIMAREENRLMTWLEAKRRRNMTKLAINVDHVATIRQARGITEPDPVTAAAICELAGAQGIVIHLREDRRHIQDRDARVIRETIKTKLNLEMGATKEMVGIALDLNPDMVTLVPEKRLELTTEGGLDVKGQKKKLAKVIEKFTAASIPVSLFIDPNEAQIKASADIGATFVELHTGLYADAPTEKDQKKEYEVILQNAVTADQLGLIVNAGHGLNYINTAPIAAIDVIDELSIGHAVIGRAVFSGLEQAVRDMKKIIENAK